MSGNGTETQIETENEDKIYENGKQNNPIRNNLLRIASWNANGISGKIEELLEFMIKENIALTLVHETWLLENRILHPTMVLSKSEPTVNNRITRAHYGMAVVIHP